MASMPHHAGPIPKPQQRLIVERYCTLLCCAKFNGSSFSRVEELQKFEAEPMLSARSSTECKEACPFQPFAPVKRINGSSPAIGSLTPTNSDFK